MSIIKWNEFFAHSSIVTKTAILALNYIFGKQLLQLVHSNRLHWDINVTSCSNKFSCNCNAETAVGIFKPLKERIPSNFIQRRLIFIIISFSLILCFRLDFQVVVGVFVAFTIRIANNYRQLEMNQIATWYTIIILNTQWVCVSPIHKVRLLCVLIQWFQYFHCILVTDFQKSCVYL